ncbi:choline dehydrogenase [Favolaschia claudopus]|uniref:Choline dehydrogenase n=1 Tax=Favolaschia claudopus TaxID=2862362 RepID=A0AAW0CSQ7_9AGAR
MPGLLTATFLALLASPVFAAASTLPSCPSPSTQVSVDSDIYDYIVVGAGAGGGPVAARLAENGFSGDKFYFYSQLPAHSIHSSILTLLTPPAVLLVETGEDESNNPNTTSLFTAFAAIDDPKIDLNYTIKEYPSNFSVQRNDEWYPRSAGIGGCTIHNAGENSIAGMRQQFDAISLTFNDPTWSRDNMQQYWALLERNLYLDPTVPDPDHGFSGWLNSSRASAINFTSTDPKWTALGTSIIAAAGPPLIPDQNSHVPLPPSGRVLELLTSDNNHLRASIRDKLTPLAASSKNLTIMTNALATKVLLCNEKKGGKVTAYGLAVAAGAKLPVAQGFNGKQKLDEKNIVARREVIVAGGAFQTPQLLMLSGIGDKAQLSEFGIPTVVDLPGVGANLQDNDELPAFWEFTSNFTDPESFGYALATSANSTSLEPDLWTYYAPFEFNGFHHGMSIVAANTQNVFTLINLRAGSNSQGYVRLTGSHPQDLLDINKLRFQGPDGKADIVVLREAIKRWRKVINEDRNIAQFVKREVAPGANITSDADLEEYILNNVFAHHACCTAAIGADGDPRAVLDGDFNVRGVNNLRVVDASSFPVSPGYFPQSPIYMISEKAAAVILKDALKARS